MEKGLGELRWQTDTAEGRRYTAELPHVWAPHSGRRADGTEDSRASSKVKLSADRWDGGDRTGQQEDVV